MEQNKRELMLLNMIKQLEFEDIDEKISIDKFENLFSKFGEEVKVLSRSDIDTSEDTEDYFFLLYDSSSSYRLNDIQDRLSNLIPNLTLDRIKNVYLIEIFDSLKQRANIYNSFKGNRVLKLREEILKKLKDNGFGQGKRNVKYLSFIVPQNLDENHKVNIKIKDRIRSLEQNYVLDKSIDDENHSPVLRSFVFTAEIDSVVDLYNLFGDKLFAKNVRVGGVMDSIGVEDDIQYTYKNAPDEFWFLNNGISLLIATEGELNMDVYDRLTFSIAELDDISIINGAQTLQALSEVRYNKKNIAVKANVLLRVYHYNSKQSKEFETGLQKFKDFSEKVTISLNKQKPIHQIDLAYLTNFVKNIQMIRHKLSENKNTKGLAFDFVRKGEIESIAVCQYHLRFFAKIVKSYLLLQPGKARSQSYNSLLKTSIPDVMSKDVEEGISEGKLVLEDEEVFKTEFQQVLLETVDDGKTKLFLKYYAPINFAMRIKKYLEEESNFQQIVNDFKEEKKIKQDKTLKMLDSFLKYGNLFMISAIINSLNDYQYGDFSEWKYCRLVNSNGAVPEKGELSKQQLKSLIFKILEVFITFKSDTTIKNVNNTNFWKKDDMIKFILDGMDTKNNKKISEETASKDKPSSAKKKKRSSRSKRK